MDLDIFSFIDSPDIQTYLKEQQYQFVTAETAFLVWYRRSKRLKEKKFEKFRWDKYSACPALFWYQQKREGACYDVL